MKVPWPRRYLSLVDPDWPPLPDRTRNGKSVKTRKVQYAQHVATLTLEETTERSAGTYTCYAANSAGEVETSCMVQIQGKSPPSDATWRTRELLG